MPLPMPSRMPIPPGPMPKPPEKPPAPAPTPEGLFGKPGDAKGWSGLRHYAETYPFEKSVLPGTSRQLGREDRVKLIDELQKLDPSMGAISEDGYRSRILPQLKKKMSQLEAAGKINDKTELGRKIQMIEKMIKGG